jgi:hypothetical protein
VKILLASYFFYPENTPRAFRATELAKEFARRGHEVTVVVPEHPADTRALFQKIGIRVVQAPAGFLRNKKAKFRKAQTVPNGAKMSPSSWKRMFRAFYEFLYPGGDAIEFAIPLANALGKMRERYGLLISIGLPISAHVGVALALRRNSDLAATTVADYGDPFSENEGLEVFSWHRWLEQWWLKQFTYVTIPIASAVGAFRQFKSEEFVRVIPQGFDLTPIALPPYQPHPIRRFAYAGSFYKKIRNPRRLFEFLLKDERRFEFHIFTDFSHAETMACLERFREELGDRLKLHDLLPREECIRMLAQFDFLINIQNSTTLQSPSKTVDYALARRPVFNCSQDFIDTERLQTYLDGSFPPPDLPDLRPYDIRTVAEQFLALA